MEASHLSASHGVEEEFCRREAAVEAVRHEALGRGKQAVSLEVGECPAKNTTKQKPRYGDMHVSGGSPQYGDEKCPPTTNTSENHPTEKRDGRSLREAKEAKQEAKRSPPTNPQVGEAATTKKTGRNMTHMYVCVHDFCSSRCIPKTAVHTTLQPLSLPALNRPGHRVSPASFVSRRGTKLGPGSHVLVFVPETSQSAEKNVASRYELARLIEKKQRVRVS